MAKQDDWVRITVRLPGALHERLTSAVAEGPNSMNSEIISRLEASFETSTSPDADLEAKLVADRAQLQQEFMASQDRIARRLEAVEQTLFALRSKGRVKDTVGEGPSPHYDDPEGAN